MAQQLVQLHNSSTGSYLTSSAVHVDLSFFPCDKVDFPQASSFLPDIFDTEITLVKVGCKNIRIGERICITGK